MKKKTKRDLIGVIHKDWYNFNALLFERDIGINFIELDKIFSSQKDLDKYFSCKGTPSKEVRITIEEI